MQRCITSTLLHVSSGFSAHHQEFKSVHAASGICQTCTAVHIWAPDDERKKPLEICRALTIIKSIIQRFILLVMLKNTLTMHGPMNVRNVKLETELMRLRICTREAIVVGLTGTSLLVTCYYHSHKKETTVNRTGHFHEPNLTENLTTYTNFSI